MYALASELVYIWMILGLATWAMVFAKLVNRGNDIMTMYFK